MKQFVVGDVMGISIHALLAESDMMFFDYAHPGCISIHALLAESDGSANIFFKLEIIFLSTLSLRRATGFCDLEPIRNPISIHALLAESDDSIDEH